MSDHIPITEPFQLDDPPPDDTAVCSIRGCYYWPLHPEPIFIRACDRPHYLCEEHYQAVTKILRAQQMLADADKNG